MAAARPPPDFPLPPTPTPSQAREKLDTSSPVASSAQDGYDEARGAEDEDADSSDSDMDPVEVRRQSQLPPSSASPQSDRTTGTPPRGKPLLRPIGVNQLYVDLGDWAPAADPSKLAPSPNYAHLPPPPSIVSSRSSNSAVDAARAPSTPSPQAVSNVAPTSHPNSHLTPLQLSISHSLSRLLSLDIFRTFIATPVGYSQFHAYLSTTSSPTTSSPAATLELYRDLSVLKTLALRSGVASRGIRDVYLIPDSEKHVETPLPAMKEMVSALRGVISGAQGLEKPATRLLEQLYANEFEGFVKYRLLRYTSVQLGKYGVEAGERKGLGEAFVLTNPRLPDQPIVLTSPAFCRLTGYSPDQIIGRNCRFLQGEATAPSSVKTIKDALVQGEEVTQLLLNYKLDGTPFWNLLCCIPLRDAKGELTYFIGGQTNITGSIASGDETDLSFILGGGQDSDASTLNGTLDPSTFSPQMQSYQSNYNFEEVDGFPEEVLAPTIAPSVKVEEEVVKEASSAGGGSFGKRFLGAFGKKKSGKSTPPMSGLGQGSQLMPAAEQLLSSMPASIENRIAEFTSTYEKLVIFQPRDHRILFVTSPFLRFCGLPGTSLRDVFASPLIHSDLLKLLTGATSAEKKEARAKVKATVRKGESASFPTVLRWKEKGAYGKMQTLPSTRGVMHLTPLRDLPGEVIAYVAVFG